MARTGLAAAARVARWADASLGPGSDGATPDGKGTLAEATAERAAEELGLTPAQVRADWDTARLAGLVEVHGDIARPAGDCAPGTATTAPSCAAGSPSSTPGRSPTPTADREASAVAEVVSAMPQVLSFLQLSAGPVPVEQLLDLLEQRVTELRTERCEIPYGPQPEPVPEAAEIADAPLEPLLDWALHALASVGALTCADGQATLTPLGSWAVWVKLEQDLRRRAEPRREHRAARLGHAPRLRTAAPERGPRRVPRLARRPPRGQRRHRTPRSRPRRGRAHPRPRLRGAARGRRPPEPDVRAVADESWLRPYALLWLAEHDGHDPEDAHEVLTREESTWLWVDTAAAVADHGEAPLLVRHLESAVQPTVPALLDEVRAVGPPPSRSWSRSPPPTRTRPSPRPYAAPPSRSTPEAARAWPWDQPRISSPPRPGVSPVSRGRTCRSSRCCPRRPGPGSPVSRSPGRSGA